MEIRVLRYFLAVAQYRNITKAASELLISQPALSNQLSALESELGVTLFTRGHRQITLTPAGEYLRDRAQDIVTLAEQTANNLQADQLISGELSIGAGESLGMQRISQVISGLIQDYPNIKIHLISGNADEMENALQRGVIDFAVLMGTRSLADYDSLQMPEVDTWGVVMPEVAPLTQKTTVQPQDLIGLPLILSEQALQEHRFQDWWGNLGSQMQVVGTFTLVFNAELLVRNRAAYLLTFGNLLDNTAGNGLTFRPLEPTLTEPITVIWKKYNVQSKLANLFIQRLTATLEDAT